MSEAEAESDAEIQAADIILEVTTWAGLSMGAVHFYGKMYPGAYPWQGEPVVLTRALSKKDAAVLNKRHGCRAGDFGAYAAGQEYNGFDDVESIKNEAVARCKEYFPDARRLVSGKHYAVDHDGVICTFTTPPD